MKRLCAVLLLAATAGAPADTTGAAPPEPVVREQTIEDDGVRIDELRVRGQTRRLVVQPKAAGVAAYEILPAEPGRDSAQDRRAGGQRVWRMFSF